MKYIYTILFIFVFCPTVYASEDFWGNELKDGDEVHILNHEHIKGEYTKYGDGSEIVRLENGDYVDLSDHDFEKE